MTNEITTSKAAEVATTAAEITEELTRQFIAFLDSTPQTAKTYAASIRRMLAYFRAHNISRPTRADVLAYRDELKANYKPASVALHMTAARLFFRWTAQQGYYPNVADHIKGAKLDRGHKKDYLTSGQVKAVLDTTEGDSIAAKRDRAILAIMVTGGLRCIEVARANIEDLRPAGDSPALYIQGKGREDKNEFAKLAPPVESAIRDYLTARGETDGHAPLFTSDSNNSRGSRITTRSISRLVKSHMVKAGYNSERLTAHSLRHTCATLNLLNGATLAETQQLLRHANINTTMIYNHAIERANNNSELRIAAAIF